LSDSDRDNIRKLHKMIFDVVAELDGQLQIIAFDHADFSDDWFQASAIETWRDGTALVPTSWINPSDAAQVALPEGSNECPSASDA